MIRETANFSYQVGNTFLDFTVTGTFYPEIRGSRDRWGAPEEPDEPAHWEIESIVVDGVEIEDYDQFCESLDMDWWTMEEICSEKLDLVKDN